MLYFQGRHGSAKMCPISAEAGYSCVFHLNTLFPNRIYLHAYSYGRKTLPSFAYMEHLASGELEEHIQSKSELRAFLNGCFGFPQGPNGEVGFTPEHGVHFENLFKLGPTALFTSRELDYYAGEYIRNGIRGPNNWYRTRELNFSNEYEYFLERPDGTLNLDPGIDQDILYIATKNDRILTPAMCEASKQFCKRHHIKVVDADHWALWENPKAVNDAIREWLTEVVFASCQ